MVAGAELRHCLLCVSGGFTAANRIRHWGKRDSAAPSNHCASACAFTTTEMTLARAEYFSTDCEYQGVQVPLPVVCPLLITPGQCARFIDEELEDLTGVWPLGYCQIHFFVCIYLCGQFLKNRKVAYENHRKEHWLHLSQAP